MKLGTVIKTFKSKKGNEVIVRYPEAADLDALTAYATTLAAEDTFIELTHVTKEDELKYLNEILERVQADNEVRLFTFIDGVFASNCGVVRQKHRQSHVGEVDIAIAKPFREEGIGTTLFEFLIAESKRIGFRLLRLYCYENNPRAIHVYEKIGFRKVGVIPGAILYKGAHVGQVIMYLTLVK